MIITETYDVLWLILELLIGILFLSNIIFIYLTLWFRRKYDNQKEFEKMVLESKESIRRQHIESDDRTIAVNNHLWNMVQDYNEFEGFSLDESDSFSWYKPNITYDYVKQIETFLVEKELLTRKQKTR
jgi:hypothetical protein